MESISFSELKSFFGSIRGRLTVRDMRVVASSMAKAIGHGGIKFVAEVSQVSRSTIMCVLSQSGSPEYQEQLGRRQGGGRKIAGESQPGLAAALKALISPFTRGDPMNPPRWTTKSLRKLAAELGRQGFGVSHVTVGEMLEGLGYTLQSCRKSHEDAGSPDRDAQFEHISQSCLAFFAGGQPVISVDSKKKELAGNFRNSGRECRPAGSPVDVSAYDFQDSVVGKAVPYGVHDIGANRGDVNVGKSTDMGEFAVASIRQWWGNVGAAMHPDAFALYINADGGGSNGVRNRLWKRELQRFADDRGLAICVSHFPPATSKWNKIEHRLFSAISLNWRGVPLVDFETVVSLFGNTSNSSGLKVTARLDTNEYVTGITVDDDELEALNIKRHKFGPEWNYLTQPRKVLVVS